MEVNLMFNGNAEEALEHYRNALGGAVEIMRFEGSPAAEFVPADWKNRVLYGTLRSPLGIVHAMDAPPGRGPETTGDNFAIGVYPENGDHTDTVFTKLGSDGTVIMPLEKTFWSPRFGMLTDKFGIKWMVSQAA